MNSHIKLQQFLELFHPLPGNNYLLVSTKLDKVADALYKKIIEVDGSFSVALYGEGTFADIKIEYIDSLSKPFRAKPRENDRVIFYDIFTQHKSQKMLLQLAYRTLANAAEIIIVEPQGVLKPSQTCELLEKMEFRAPNCIENILDGYDVFIAKKMHMWGNGL